MCVVYELWKTVQKKTFSDRLILGGKFSMNQLYSAEFADTHLYRHWWRLTKRVRSFGMIRNRLSDPRSHGSLPIKGAGESWIRADSPAPLMDIDPSDLGTLILILIFSKERTQRHPSLTRSGTWTVRSGIHDSIHSLPCCLTEIEPDNN